MPSPLLLPLVLAAQAAGPTPDDGLRVGALLEERCYRCHGPGKARSGLRLDRRETALAGGDSGLPALVPGRSEESELFRRVTAADEEERMPPEGAALGADEIELLRRWIDAGAAWPEAREPAHEGPSHWAYVAPVRPELPEVRDETWVRDPLDRFVLARLEAEGLAPAPEADRVTLVRRLSLDLLGLPPSVEDVDAFLADERPDAYERLVDRLLASPAFAERWAQPWLDAARYADSNGYTIDTSRSMWPWRDWVVGAIDADLPFDEFTIEQLAGDLLPEPTRDQLVATGFHRNSQINEEGGVDDEEFRIAAVIDRVDTTATVWLGTTLACARCHSHKFDPFTIQDYYSFFALFNDTVDRGTGTDAPRLALPTPAEEAELARIEARLEVLRYRLERPDPELAEARRAWERRRREELERWRTVDVHDVTTSEGTRLAPQPDGSLLVGEERPNTDVYTLHVATDLADVRALRLEVLADPSLPRGGPGLAKNGNFILNEVAVAAYPADESSPEAPRPIAITSAVADFFQDVSEANTWPIEAAIDGDPLTGWAILPRTGSSHVAVLELAEPVGAGRTRSLVVTLDQTFGGRHTIGRLRLSAMQGTPPAGSPAFVEPELARVLTRPEAEREADERALLWRAFAEEAPELAPVREEIASLEESRPDPVTTLVMQRRAEPRETHVLLRGSFLDPGPVVQPDTPDVLPPLAPRGPRADRLDLAHWLVADENPLTARVTVNRWWQHLFGTGLVATQNDFGTRGAPPTHPELLDWLAVELRELGWSRKRLLRRLVTSATYRQASLSRPELEARDPSNALLARQPRLRVDAEVIRDSALAASGLLDLTLGGPPVHPPAPPEVFTRTEFAKAWPVSQGPDRFRRTLYTRHWRSVPHPFLATFDGGVGQVTCTRRDRSNTPLQALAMANDPMLVELARGLAARALRLAAADERARLGLAFRWCVARAPEEAELDVLARLLEEERRSFAARPEDARAAAPADLPDDVEPARGAAWTAVARVLLNLDEFLVRE